MIIESQNFADWLKARILEGGTVWGFARASGLWGVNRWAAGNGRPPRWLLKNLALELSLWTSSDISEEDVLKAWNPEWTADPNSFAAWLKRQIEPFGLLTDFATASDIPPASVYSWAKGDTFPTGKVDQLSRLAEAITWWTGRSVSQSEIANAIQRDPQWQQRSERVKKRLENLSV